MYLALLTSLLVYQVLASGFGNNGNGEPSEYLESVWLGSVPIEYYLHISNVKCTKESGKSKDAFKTMAKKHILETCANKNIK